MTWEVSGRQVPRYQLTRVVTDARSRRLTRLSVASERTVRCLSFVSCSSVNLGNWSRAPVRTVHIAR